jgi:hypothetical protein
LIRRFTFTENLNAQPQITEYVFMPDAECAIAQDTTQDTSTNALAPNQTAAFGASMLVFTYTENFDCIDAAKDDLNFSGILAESDPLEFQAPICQVGKEPKHDPTGALATTTDKLWVMPVIPLLPSANRPGRSLAQ